MNLNRVLKVLLACSILLVAGCASMSGPVSYGPDPVPQTIKGSYKQVFQKLVVEHDVEDVRKAVIEAAGMNGLTFDNIEENRLSGTGNWVYPGFTGGCEPKQIYVVYMSKSGKRKTTVTFILDHMSFCASGMDPHILLQKLVSGMNSVLATYD